MSSDRLKKWFWKWQALVAIRRADKRAANKRITDNSVRRQRARLFAPFAAAAAAAGVSLGPTPAQADTAFTSFAFAGTGTTATRTTPDRIADVYNLKEFGALGNGVADDAPKIKTAIQTCFSTSSPHASGACLYAPPGSYNCGSLIDFGALGGTGRGRFYGAGRDATAFTGTINNNFVFTCKNGDNGFQELSNMSIANFSTVPGTGALRWINNNTCSALVNMNFTGQIGLDMTFNSFHVNVFGCNFSPTSTLSPGSVAIITNSASLIGCRWSHFEMGLMLGGNGSNGVVAHDTSGEDNGIGYLLGTIQGWSSACTIAPDGSNPGFSILTVGGEISPANTGGAIQQSFLRFYSLYGSGLPTTWATPLGGVQITADNFSDPTLTGIGFAGTYRIAGTFTISSPVPMMTRALWQIAGAKLSGGQTEGCYHGLYVAQAVDCSVDSFQFTGVVGEAAGPTGEKTLTAHSHIYISTAGEFKMTAVRSGTGTFVSSIYFETTAATNGVTLESCNPIITANSVTDATTTFNGTTMTVNAMGVGNLGTIGIGMPVTAAGLTGSPKILSCNVAPGGAGIYTLDISQSTLSGRVATIIGGTDWILPTSGSNSRAGLQINNCAGAKTPSITFNELPGQAGNNAALGGPFDGQAFDLTDSATAASGNFAANVTVGGSTNHVRARWNAGTSHWTISG